MEKPIGFWLRTGGTARSVAPTIDSSSRLMPWNGSLCDLEVEREDRLTRRPFEEKQNTITTGSCPDNSTKRTKEKKDRMLTNTIIANCGEGNVGKTGSILLLYAKLRKAAGMDVPDGLLERNEDICEEVTINGIRVGISSFGDTLQTVKEHLDELKDSDCQIIVTACRNNHEMIKLLKEYKEEYRLIRTSNARLYKEETNPRLAPKGLCDRFNEQWAEEIARLIESWCYA